MNVKGLIAELERLNPDLEVIMLEWDDVEEGYKAFLVDEITVQTHRRYQNGEKEAVILW